MLNLNAKVNDDLSINLTKKNDDLSINLTKKEDSYLLTITEGAFIITLPVFNTTIESVKYWLDNNNNKTPFESVLYNNYMFNICFTNAERSLRINITYYINQRAMAFEFITCLNMFRAWINLLYAYENKN